MVRNVIKITAVYIASVVGAGFATGKEIGVFFGNYSVAVPIVAGMAMGAFALVFMLLGRGTEDVITSIFGRCGYAIKAIVVLVNFVIFATMIAGAELIFRECYAIRGIGVISGICAIPLVGKNGKALSAISTVCLPIVVVITVFFAITHGSNDAMGSFRLIPPIAYAGMNILTGGYLIAGYTKEASIKQCILTAIIIAIICSILLVCVYMVARDYANTPMPIYSYASQRGYTVLSGVMILVAIFSTMATSLKVVSAGCYINACIATAFALLLALVGFDNLVTYCYPVIGYVGMGFCACAVCAIAHKVKSEVVDFFRVES